jgi:hypothetical protein
MVASGISEPAGNGVRAGMFGSEGGLEDRVGARQLHACASQISAVAAEAHSLTGSRYRTLAALEQADRHLEQAQPGDAPSWLREFMPARMQHYRGACLARVGHARYSATILHDALDRHAPASNNRALIHADLAIAYARLKEPEQACAALTRGAEAVRRSRSAMRYERLHAARSYPRPLAAGAVHSGVGRAAHRRRGRLLGVVDLGRNCRGLGPFQAKLAGIS